MGRQREGRKKNGARPKASPPGQFSPPGTFSWPAPRAPGLVTQTANQTARIAPAPTAHPYYSYSPTPNDHMSINMRAAAIAAQTALFQATLLRNSASYQQQLHTQATQQYPLAPSRIIEQSRRQEESDLEKPAKEACHMPEDQPIYIGVLQTFSPKDGYGFIRCPELRERFPDRDVYIHKAQMPEGASCGCNVSFCLHLNPKGQPQARDVTLVENLASEAPEAVSSTELLLDFAWESLPDEAPLRVQSGAHSANAVRICSWNILAVAYANCKAFPDVEPSVLSWGRRRALVARALEMMNADVVCLQEVDRPLEDLGLQEYDQVRAQRPDGRADGCIIAWKRGSFTLVNEEVISFDNHVPAEELDSLRFRRGNCAAIAELRRSSTKGERSFLVATTHLCWEAECEDVRQQQAKVLLERLEALSRRLGHRTVLCGDLNAMPGCASHRTITEAMPSVYRDLEAEDTVTNSNACAGPAVIHGGDDVAPHVENGRRGKTQEKEGFAGMLDYLCLDARGAKVSSRLRLPGRPEIRDKLGKGTEGPLPTLLSASWPSDHLPVCADVNFAVVFQ